MLLCIFQGSSEKTNPLPLILIPSCSFNSELISRIGIRVASDIRNSQRKEA